MIDIHTHIIPQIDDGSKSIEESINMMKQAENAGFTDIISTSHYIEEGYNVEEDKRKQYMNKLNKLAKIENIDVKLYLGSEIYVTPNMMKMIKEHKASTLAGSKYVLFELPMNNNILYLDEIIFELKSENLIPVIAHPERYKIVQENPNIISEWIERGALIQSNFASIIGYYGKNAKNTMKKMIKANMIHFLGSDAHNSDKYLQIPQCMIKLEKIIGKQKLDLLTNINPKHIIDNQELVVEKVEKIKDGFFK